MPHSLLYDSNVSRQQVGDCPVTFRKVLEKFAPLFHFVSQWASIEKQVQAELDAVSRFSEGD